MTHDQDAVAIVMVAYGHAEHLHATLAAVERLHHPNFTTIVVENGDGASAAVARSFSGVMVLEQGRNLGFAGGCNLGVAHTTAPTMVLVNPDLQPHPSFLAAITAPLHDPNVGIVGAKLVYPDGRLQHAGGYLREPTMLAQHWGYGETDHGQFNTARSVPFVTGAALAMRRATWDALGGLDETFFPGYYEEVDLCWRARQQGLQVHYEPHAVAVHHEAAALGKGSPTYHRLYHHNRLRFVFKHHDHAWLLHEWLPAEFAHLRTTADDAEIDALIEAYVFWQVLFSGINTDAKAEQRSTFNVEPATGELAWIVEQVGKKHTVTPHPFRSRWPFVAGVRQWVNRLATETYVRPLIQQQNDYNAALHEAITALARQRRTADAAILCQGMLLAKFLKAPS